VYQSSTASFQQSWAPEQHASLAALRAAESGRPVVHATLSGVSTAYDAEGRRVGSPLGTGSAGVLVVDLPVPSGRTPYAAVGETLPTLAVWVVILAAAGSVRRRRATVDAGAQATTHEIGQRP
jgi:apolipoprotein N-acyltransferase